MKKRFIQLRTTYQDLMNLLKRFRNRVFKFFLIDKLLKLRLVIYLFKWFKIGLKLFILFKLTLFIIKAFDYSIYLNLVALLSALYSLLKDDLLFKVKDSLLNYFKNIFSNLSFDYSFKYEDKVIKSNKDNFVERVQVLKTEVDQLNDIKAQHNSINESYTKDFIDQENQILQFYKKQLEQLKDQYNHLLLDYKQPNVWIDWWNKEKWNILYYSGIIIMTIGLCYYAYSQLDTITDYIKSIFYVYVIKAPFDYICDKSIQFYNYLSSFFGRGPGGDPGFDGDNFTNPSISPRSIYFTDARTTEEIQNEWAHQSVKRINEDHILSSESGSDSDRNFKNARDHYFTAESDSDTESTISERSSTSTASQGTVVPSTRTMTPIPIEPNTWIDENPDFVVGSSSDRLNQILPLEHSPDITPPKTPITPNKSLFPSVGSVNMSRSSSILNPFSGSFTWGSGQLPNLDLGSQSPMDVSTSVSELDTNINPNWNKTEIPENLLDPSSATSESPSPSIESTLSQSDNNPNIMIDVEDNQPKSPSFFIEFIFIFYILNIVL